MIYLKVNEAYAFDFLAILQIKFEIDPTNNSENYNDCSLEIKKQIGNDREFDNIISSQEYKNLYLINKKTFEAVDLAKEEKVSAKYVDECNYERFLAKKALQDKFFPEDNYKENKIGYEQNG
jgi:hypothetical protein